MVRTTALLAALIAAGCAQTPVTTRVERQVIKVEVPIKARPDRALLECGRNLPALRFHERADLPDYILLRKADALTLMQIGDELAGCVLTWRTWAAP